MYLEYGIRNNALTHISEVASGLKCGCICPACGGVLIARKGKIMAHHFAHQGAECAYAGETALHMMAKTILEKELKIRLPEVYIDFGGRSKALVSESIELKFDEVFLEKRLNSIVPDVLIKIGEKLLVVEIWVTHRIDDEKRNRLADEHISALEIDLSSIDRSIAYDDLRDILLGQSEHKKWAYNDLSEYYKKRWLSICEKRKTITRGFAIHIDLCPIKARVWHGKPYANFIDDCTSCDFFIDYERNENDEEQIFCCGHTGVRTLNDLKTYLHAKKVKQVEA